MSKVKDRYNPSANSTIRKLNISSPNTGLSYTTANMKSGMVFKTQQSCYSPRKVSNTVSNIIVRRDIKASSPMFMYAQYDDCLEM